MTEYQWVDLLEKKLAALSVEMTADSSDFGLVVKKDLMKVGLMEHSMELRLVA
jgi:hypothetical protein